MHVLSALSDPNNLKLFISAATLFLGFVGGIVALFSFWAAEKWKKAEFLATKVKDFNSNEAIRKTKLFIDWDLRKIQLLSPSEPDGGLVKVDRLLQAAALRPHTIMRDGSFVSEHPDADSDQGGSIQYFTKAEVAIRDCYDEFLDALETFNFYVMSDLTKRESLRPYLKYWIGKIAAPARNSQDAAWKAALITYIAFYQYDSVFWLARKFYREISPFEKGGSYKKLLSKMEDQQFASGLEKSIQHLQPKTR